MRLLGLSLGDLAGLEDMAACRVRDTCWDLASFFLPCVRSPAPSACLLWPVGTAFHSSPLSLFFTPGAGGRGVGGRRGHSRGASGHLVLCPALYVWEPIVLVLLAFSR